MSKPTVHPGQLNCMGCDSFRERDGEMTCTNAIGWITGVPENPPCFQGTMLSMMLNGKAFPGDTSQLT